MTAGSSPKSKQQKLITSFIRLAGKRFEIYPRQSLAEVWGSNGSDIFDSHDGGRDGAFHGMWRSSAGGDFEGTFTVPVQVCLKRLTSSSNSPISRTSFLKRTASPPVVYRIAIFFFQTPDSPASPRSESAPRLEAIHGIKRFAAFGCERISASFESRHDFQCWCLVSMD